VRAKRAAEAAHRRKVYVAALIHAVKIHRDIQLRAKAQATPPQPSPTAAGEGVILAKLDFPAVSDL